MKLRSALLSATLLALPAAAMAQQPVTGLYVGGGLGYNWQQNIDIKSLNIGSVSTGGGGKLNGDGGPVAVASVGWGLGNGFRVELEGNYLYDHTRITDATGVGGGANLQTYGLMVNGLYDFNNVSPIVTPYVGVGAGYEWTQAKGGRAYTTAGIPASFEIGNNTEGSPAAQAILGVAFPMPVPGLAVTIEYRFMATFENEKFHGSGTALGASVPGSVKLGNQYNHAGLIGLRYAFGAAPPPPPPPAPAPAAAPAPAPARTYLVFFDWDKADLTGRARQVIAEAAQNSTRVQYTRIVANGYADLTGSHAYNMKLSLQRARNVEGELVHDGVPQNVIDIHGFGDTNPLVPTAEGVREPQNRRVEIIIQ